jgi:hypothetical protein
MATVARPNDRVPARANITWRQEVGATAIEASKIAGHSQVQMTSKYTYVVMARQRELTRPIQDQLQGAAEKEGKQREQQAQPASAASADELLPAKPASQRAM